MKKVISLALLGATTSLMAMYAEQAYLYKDPRIMGMGGANIAVGSYSTSVFSNPAGLANIKKEHGFVFDLFSVGVSTSGEMGDFSTDLQDANDEEDDGKKTEAIADVLAKYSGEHFHIGVDNYSSISKNSDLFAWSIGLLSALDINIMAHGNGSSNGELLETTSRAYSGVVVGIAKPYDTKIGRLDVGMGFKYISQQSYEGTLGISELITDEDEEIQDKFQERYEQKSSGFGVDIGATFKPYKDNFWHPAIAFSILNIGSLGMDDNYGGQPMTLNIGASISPEVSYISKFVFAIDYVDVLGANELRIYNYDEDDNVVYSDYTSSSFMKNLRLGTSIGLVDSTFFSTTLNLGFYQSAYTAGLDMEILMFKLNAATYQEEIGDDSTSIVDRRYMAQIGIGW
ncbi:MAG: conjugal transfer protein TraF [Campylobacterota bacterium]|nr:conjugal transfer protein TraF [Campylobacterota bacterium]